MTIADLKQTIGRATRTCGQKGLDFIPNIGWPLYVYNYFITVPSITQNTFSVSKLLTNNPDEINDNKDEDILVFKNIEKFNDATMLYSEFDRAMNNLSTQLYEIGPILAVDHYLTNNLHNIEDLNHEIMEKDYYLMGGTNERDKNIKNAYKEMKYKFNDTKKTKILLKGNKNKPRFDGFAKAPKNTKKIKQREPTPKEPIPKEPTPKEPTPKEPTPKEPTPKEPTPKEPTPKESTPKEPTPKESILDQLISDQSISDQSISNQSISNQPISEENSLSKIYTRPSKNIEKIREKTMKIDYSKDFMKKVNRESKFFKIDNIICHGKCGKRSTKDVPVPTSFLKHVYLKYKHPKKLLQKQNLREWLCNYMRNEDNGYCRQLNNEWVIRYAYVPNIIENNKNMTEIKKELDNLQINIVSDEETNENSENTSIESSTPTNSHILDNVEYPLLEYNGKKDENSEAKNTKTKVIVPKNKLGFLKMRDFIKTNYNLKKYKWDHLIIENKCIEKPKNNNKKENNTPHIELNPTQNFITDYFCPESPYKGLLLWHSVGTGKTCSGVSIASTSFERAGYSILWITRTTLKSDVWKNIFDQICHSIIAHEVEKGLLIPDDISKRKRLLSDRWLEPMSYKQFSNLLAGKNAIYDILKNRNGTEDILKKTLIIIDEGHKLYGGDLKAAERPDTKIMEKLIMNSYKKSGNDSCKLLIMTATPFTNTPLELFSLINLFYTNEEEKITTNKRLLNNI